MNKRFVMGAERRPQGYEQTSYWLASCGDDLTPRPPVAGDVTVDIAILGGGFSGLWTAYCLLKANPQLEVAIIEREICGFGASGRNGGWCSSRFPQETAALIEQRGREHARATLNSLRNAVADIRRTCLDEGIDAEFRDTGLLSLARSEKQLGAAKAAYETLRSLDLDDDLRILNAEEASSYVRATNIAGGLRTSWGANIHPGKLVRGLARAVERRGGRIFEGSDVTGVRTGVDAALITASGTVRAGTCVVIAGEAYLAAVKRYRRKVLPVSSMIVLTEPISEGLWSTIGWENGESLCSYVNTKNYLTRTSDGRILYGSRGAPYAFGSKLNEAAVRDERVFQWMRECLHDWWPQLADVRITHNWGGFIGVPRNWTPTVSFDRKERLGQIFGYAGRGVATSVMASKVLAARILGEERARIKDAASFNERAPNWEIEPFRWAGVRYIQDAYARMDKAEAAKRPAPWDARFAKKIGGL